MGGGCGEPSLRLLPPSTSSALAPTVVSRPLVYSIPSHLQRCPAWYSASGVKGRSALGGEGWGDKSAIRPRCVARIGAPPTNQVLGHAPYLYVMVCQASVLQRGADQQSFDTLLLGSQPCLLALCLVTDCLAWDQMLAMFVCQSSEALFGLVWA